jgi:hypothetical protein
MQKLADGHDTDVGSSPPWLWSRFVAAPHDLLHPVAAPISRMNTQANASLSRLVMCGRADGDVPVNEARHATVILSICLVPTVRPSPFRYQAG